MKIRVTIKGVSPLLMNRFIAADLPDGNTGSSQVIKANKGTPKQQAEKKLYKDGKGRLMIPGANIFACLVSAGKFQKVGKSKLTTQKSSLVPAGIAVEEAECLLGKAKWEVDSRAVVNPHTGGRMICHRPVFKKWSLTFTVQIDESMFTEDVVRQLIHDGGRKLGLGDFRPERRGWFGRFSVSDWKLI